MPAKLDSCIKKVKRQGSDESSAYAICSKSTGWKVGKGSTKKKKKWVKESTHAPRAKPRSGRRPPRPDDPESENVQKSKRTAQRARDRAEKRSGKEDVQESRWVPQNKRGSVDKHDPRSWKTFWRGIIESAQNQLPVQYRRLKYIGPFPPTDAPLFSSKRSDEVQRVHLFFGKHRHDPEDRIRVEIGRRGPYEWKVLGVSRVQSKQNESTLYSFNHLCTELFNYYGR